MEQDFHGQLDLEYCFGDDCDSVVESESEGQSVLSKLIGSNSTLDAMLLLMSIITGLLAIVLAIDIYRKRDTHS